MRNLISKIRENAANVIEIVDDQGNTQNLVCGKFAGRKGTLESAIKKGSKELIQKMSASRRQVLVWKIYEFEYKLSKFFKKFEKEEDENVDKKDEAKKSDKNEKENEKENNQNNKPGFIEKSFDKICDVTIDTILSKLLFRDGFFHIRESKWDFEGEPPFAIPGAKYYKSGVCTFNENKNQSCYSPICPSRGFPFSCY
jgi:hypothetical protein